MIILDTNVKLEAVLAGAVSANQPEAHVNYQMCNSDGKRSAPSLQRTALNSGTDVTILAAPISSDLRKEIFFVSIYNKDTAAVTATVKTDDGTTERIVVKKVLNVAETLVYESGQGWSVF